MFYMMSTQGYGVNHLGAGCMELKKVRVREHESTQQSWSVLSPLIGLVYLDPGGTRSGPENVMFTVVVLLNLTNE